MPTASGAYHVACTEQPERVRRFLFMLMEKEYAQKALLQNIDAWAERLESSMEEMLDFLYLLQNLSFIEAISEPPCSPAGPLEKILPPLLTVLSGSGKGLLSDRQGFYIANVGFSHETAEELSALAADLSALQERHHYLLTHNLGLRMRAWGLVSGAGNSRIGFWPLQIGNTEFNLAISDAPYLNQQAFRDLVWVLSQRYAG